jgi:hypothetical protein
MRRLWLIFAQTVTVSLAVLFVVTTLKPEWLGKHAPAGAGVVALQESSPATAVSCHRQLISRCGEEGTALGGAYFHLAEGQGAA